MTLISLLVSINVNGTNTIIICHIKLNNDCNNDNNNNNTYRSIMIRNTSKGPVNNNVQFNHGYNRWRVANRD